MKKTGKNVHDRWIASDIEIKNLHPNFLHPCCADNFKTVIPDYLDPECIPKHIACVMDGNGRWAEKRGLKRTDGHTAGEKALFDVVEGAIEIGVNWFTVFAFSTENWKRPAKEVQFLLDFNEQIITTTRRTQRKKCTDLFPWTS